MKNWTFSISYAKLHTFMYFNLLLHIIHMTTFQTFTDKLKSLKKETKQMEKRVKEFRERPEALATLDSMLNQSSFFLDSLKNISSMETEDKVFTDVEIETLEKLINETEVGHCVAVLVVHCNVFYKFITQIKYFHFIMIIVGLSTVEGSVKVISNKDVVMVTDSSHLFYSTV